MHDKLLDPDDDTALYVVEARDTAESPNKWLGHVVAETIEDAELVVRESYPDTNLGLHDIHSVQVWGKVVWSALETRLRSPSNPDEVLFREDGTVKRVHKGMLDNE